MSIKTTNHDDVLLFEFKNLSMPQGIIPPSYIGWRQPMWIYFQIHKRSASLGDELFLIPLFPHTRCPVWDGNGTHAYLNPIIFEGPSF